MSQSLTYVFHADTFGQQQGGMVMPKGMHWIFVYIISVSFQTWKIENKFVSISYVRLGLAAPVGTLQHLQLLIDTYILYRYCTYGIFKILYIL